MEHIHIYAEYYPIDTDTFSHDKLIYKNELETIEKFNESNEFAKRVLKDKPFKARLVREIHNIEELSIRIYQRK